MSSYDQAARDLETKQQQAKGEESFLSFDERKQLQRMLSFPEEFPKKFGAWIQDYIALNGQFTQSQVQGLASFSFAADKIPATGDAGQSTTATSYTDLSTVGPSLQVGSGKYALLFGCHCLNSGAGGGAGMSPSINSVTAVDADSVSMTGAGGISVSRVLMTDLSDANNTIVMKYRSVTSGTATFYRRFLVAIRYGNA